MAVAAALATSRPRLCCVEIMATAQCISFVASVDLYHRLYSCVEAPALPSEYLSGSVRGLSCRAHVEDTAVGEDPLSTADG
jgi:hypothetical protein